jgi:hypothetical protein
LTVEAVLLLDVVVAAGRVEPLEEPRTEDDELRVVVLAELRVGVLAELRVAEEAELRVGVLAELRDAEEAELLLGEL